MILEQTIVSDWFFRYNHYITWRNGVIFMKTELAQKLYTALEENLTAPDFLERIDLSLQTIQWLLVRYKIKEKILYLNMEQDSICKEVEELCYDALRHFTKEPEKGWLTFFYYDIERQLFPESFDGEISESLQKAELFYMEVLHCVLKQEELQNKFEPTLYFLMPTEEELKQSGIMEEYREFLTFCKQFYVFEFMRIGSEITPFHTLGHIAGVHYVAMHAARQLKKQGVPVDLAMVSAASIGHDIGKYGCRSTELSRVAYLHYYYTDQCLKRNKMPGIAYIAANHSTWDLELEDLSVESLLLIYADFRVKSSRNEAKKEIVHFYSLADSFDVILNKLDNVDAAKRDRYIHVYSKLADFETYMIDMGVSTVLSIDMGVRKERKNPALMNITDLVDQYKYRAIDHNIVLMNKIGNEISFGRILEAARSEIVWHKIRAFVQIFKEYCTYMNQKQKMLTLNFLYEFLIHREGDIRRESAKQMGQLIVNYDMKYRKELPEDVRLPVEEINSVSLFGRYVSMILFPDHKITDRHRRWMGNMLGSMIASVMKTCLKKDRILYLREFSKFFYSEAQDDVSSLYVMNAYLDLPLDICERDDIEKLLAFLSENVKKKNPNLNIVVLRLIHYFVETVSDFSSYKEELMRIMDCIPEKEFLSSTYLLNKMKRNLTGDTRKIDISSFFGHEMISYLFRENLKTATSWNVKQVNMDLLLEFVVPQGNAQAMQTATHLSNLLTVSQSSTVRHKAGNSLLAMIEGLSLDQRNEIAIELLHGLEIGEYEFSKYVPEYLGKLMLYLHPNELDELIGELSILMLNANDKVACVALDTIGIVIQNYSSYRSFFGEEEEIFESRRNRLFGFLLRGLTNYHESVSQEAFFVIGQYIFGDGKLNLEEKCQAFFFMNKKILHILNDQTENQLTFYNNAACLNHMYRFISDYLFSYQKFNSPEYERIAFFPGTFDPFTLSHKEIAKEIRNQGFEVYLAVDEFSWSKKTQPHLIRRQIVNMSIAEEGHIYLFPDNSSVNIANPKDLGKLKGLFPGREIYIVVGSDVIDNASAYRKNPVKNSIHHWNHIVFRRRSEEEGSWLNSASSDRYGAIKKEVLELTLPEHFEDISSTRIRENIDYNRDISSLIDPVVERFIYDHSLYLREPQYKPILKSKALKCQYIRKISEAEVQELCKTVLKEKNFLKEIQTMFLRKDVRTVILRDESRENRPIAVACYRHIKMDALLEEFKSIETTTQIRNYSYGKVVLLMGIYTETSPEFHNLLQLLLTETLAECLRQEYTYAIYHYREEYQVNQEEVEQVLKHQGFVEFSDKKEEKDIFVVDMKRPTVLLQNMATAIKEPLNSNRRVLQTLEEARLRLQKAIVNLYPKELVLSMDAGVMHHRLIEKITMENHVPNQIFEARKMGNKMCVPYGKILRGSAIPNTVTKVLHTEKVFELDMERSSIREFPNYASLDSQLQVIKSFDRTAILVDDILHKGYRLKELSPMIEKHEILVGKLLVGVLTGRGKDLAETENYPVDCAYFLPNLHAWFAESSLYPFVGGDSVARGGQNQAGLLPSVNMMLPYVVPHFLAERPIELVYEYSMTCLSNARDILKVLEEEYQKLYERNLTLSRLSEVILSPTIPEKGAFIHYNMKLPASLYISNDIERLRRLRYLVSK